MNNVIQMRAESSRCEGSESNVGGWYPAIKRSTCPVCGRKVPVEPYSHGRARRAPHTRQGALLRRPDPADDVGPVSAERLRRAAAYAQDQTPETGRTCEGSVPPEPLPANRDAGHNLVYRGHGPSPDAGWEDLRVSIEVDGQRVGLLPHIVKHSPDGFAWGYAGSGPAELARCLLIHALDLEPDCEECGGTGYANGAPGPGEGRRPCWWCDGGYRTPTPRQYQAFKFEVIAQLPQDEGWTLSRDEIRAWAAAHPAEEGAER